MTNIAVIANAGKTFGDGLPGLRRALELRGVPNPFWTEVSKSKKAPRQVERALETGAELIFAWGGDGLVQRCLDVLAGTKTALAILPAGTANLLATNLGIPKDMEQAVDVGLDGERRRLDVGRLNGERFGVMAGAGFDAAIIHDADGALKDRLGRASYLLTGARSLRTKPFEAQIAIDGERWYRGKASCILVGNVGQLFGGIELFDRARPDDGRLDIGVVTADGLVEWGRTLARTAAGHPERSPFVRVTSGKKFDVKLDRKVRYELDGGDRVKAKQLKVRVEPKAVTICVPRRSR
jgi:YegS/Rv2252/BmrU family lipid kinase